jgi:hypothetical protein
MCGPISSPFPGYSNMKLPPSSSELCHIAGLYYDAFKCYCLIPHISEYKTTVFNDKVTC